MPSAMTVPCALMPRTHFSTLLERRCYDTSDKLLTAVAGAGHCAYRSFIGQIPISVMLSPVKAAVGSIRWGPWKNLCG